MTMTNEEFAERVTKAQEQMQALEEAFSKFQDQLNEMNLSNGQGQSTTQAAPVRPVETEQQAAPTQSNNQAAAMSFDLDSLTPENKQDLATNLSDVHDKSQEVSQTVGGIDLDDLLAGVNTNQQAL